MVRCTAVERLRTPERALQGHLDRINRRITDQMVEAELDGRPGRDGIEAKLIAKRSLIKDRLTSRGKG